MLNLKEIPKIFVKIVTYEFNRILILIVFIKKKLPRFKFYLYKIFVFRNFL